MTTNDFIISARLELKDFQKDINKLVGELQVAKNKVEKGLTSKVTVDSKAASADVGEFNQTMGQSAKVIEGASISLKDLNKDMLGTSNNLKDVGRRVFVWGALSAAIFGALQEIKQLFDVTVKVNTEMTQLKKILPTGTDFNFLKNVGFDFAIEFGQPPTEVLSVFKQFAQAGLEVKESVEATRAALLAMNVTGASSTEAFDALIGAARIFKIEFSELETVVDKVQAVEKTSAVNTQDLIESITAIGPAITTFGGDIDDLFGLVSALTEAARISGSEASNTLKRVLTKFAAPETIKALQRVGVNVMETGESFRDVTDILGDLSDKLREFKEQGREADIFPALVALADTRQVSKLIALLSNYDRALQGIKISQNAFRQAMDANRTVMESYEKRNARLTAEIQKFSEEIFTSGLLQGVQDFKSVLSGLLAVVSAIPGPVLAAAATFGVFFLALKGLKAGLFGFSGELAKLQRGYSSLTLASKKNIIIPVVDDKGKQIIDKVTGQPQTQDIAATSFQRLALGATIAAGALIIVKGAMDSLRRSTITINSLLEAQAKKFEEFSKSLGEIDFIGLADFSINRKTEEVLRVFRSMSSVVGTTSEKALVLRERFSQLFFGVSTANLTQTQLEALSKTIDTLGKQLLTISFETLFTRINVLVSEGLKPAVDDLINFEEGGVLQKAKALGRSIWRNVAGGILGVTSHGLLLGPVLDESSRAATEFSWVIESAAASLKKMNAEIQEIKFAPDFIGPRFTQEALNFTDVVEKTANALLKLPSFRKILKDSLGDMSGVLGEEAEGASESAKLFNAVFQRIGDILKEKLEATGKVQELKAVEEALASLRAEVDKSGKGIALVGTSISSFLAAVKRSALTVVSDFSEQLKIVGQLSSAYNKVGVSFKATAEVAKLANAAFNEFQSRVTANISKLSELKNELKATKAHLATLVNRKTTASAAEAIDEIARAAKGLEVQGFAEDITEDENKLTKLTEEIKTQKIIVEQEKAIFEEAVGIYVQIIKLTEELQELDKRREKSLEAQTNNLINYRKFLISINKIRILDPFQELSANQEIFRDILNVQLEQIDTLEKQGLLEKSIAETKRQELILSAESEDASRRMETVLGRIDTLYKEIDSDVDSIADSVKGLLTDQSKFFDLLEGKTNFAEFLGEAFKGIGAAFADRDAETIANAIRNPVRDALVREKEELKLLLEKSQDPDLFIKAQTQAFPGLESSIKSAHEIGGSLAGQKLIEEIEKNLIPRLEELKAKLNFPESLLSDKQFAPLIKAEEDQLKQLEIIAKNTSKDKKPEIVSEGEKAADKLKRSIEDKNTSPPENIGDSFSKAIEDIKIQSPEIVIPEIDFKEINSLDVSVLQQEGLNILDEFLGAVQNTQKKLNDVPMLQGQPTLDVELKNMPEEFNPADFLPALEPDKSELNLGPLTNELKALVRLEKSFDAWEEEQTRELKEIARNTQMLVLPVRDLPSINDSTANFVEGFDDVQKIRNKEMREALARRLGVMFSQALGSAIASAGGRNTQGVQVGGQLGGLAGFALSGGNPLGAAIGEIAGSIFGGLFGGKEEEEKQTQELIQIAENTGQLVDRLSPEIFNAPVGFSLPSAQSLRGGVTVSIGNININGGGSTQDVAREIAASIEESLQRSFSKRSIF